MNSGTEPKATKTTQGDSSQENDTQGGGTQGNDSPSDGSQNPLETEDKTIQPDAQPETNKGEQEPAQNDSDLNDGDQGQDDTEDNAAGNDKSGAAGDTEEPEAQSLFNAFTLLGTSAAKTAEVNADGNTDDGTGNKTETVVKKIVEGKEEVPYASLKDAINAIDKNDPANLVLQKDISEDIVIPGECSITLDLHGYTLTNSSNHTIINNGTLVITNSDGDKQGIVDNITDQRAAIYNEAGGEVTIEENCLITRSKETGQGFSIKGDNSYNTIINQGSLTINGASVTQGQKGGGYSHLISNGWRSVSAAASASGSTACVTITEGLLSGGLTNIENYYLGEVYISGGTFKDAEYNSICNYNIAEIEDGSFSIRVGTNGSVIYNRQRNDDTAIGKLNISGGSFKGNLQNVAGVLEVTGGTFTNVVASELIPYGYTCNRQDDGSYIVTEGQSSEKASMSIGSNAADIISAGASKKETETVTLIVSDILENTAVSTFKPTGLNSAFDLSSFLSSSAGSVLSNRNEPELYLKATLTEVTLKEKAGSQSEEGSLKLSSMKYEAYPTVKGQNSSGETVSVSLESNNSQFLNGESIQFRLPVPSMVTESFVKITHESEGFENEVSYSRILGTGSQKYTSVSCTHFSSFVLEFVDSIPGWNTSGSESSGGAGLDSISKATLYAADGGAWQQDAKGWWFRRTDGSWPKSEWMECRWNGVASWYHFNAEGYADAGWFTDADGQRYFLHNLHDGSFGYMYTGWNQIGDSWYYFNTETREGKSKGSL
ncbi:MAG: hypothetical protein PUC98_04200, partial [Clostridiales bacterium]|nr:hypothetical protein [Clostridiales bacterium]